MKTATNQNRLSWFFTSLEGKLMNNSKLIGSVFLVGMSMILCAKTFACICAPCPPCSHLISGWPDCDCEWDCGAGVCCNGSCCNGTCCNGSCCTSTNCKSCVNEACVVCGGNPNLSCCDSTTCYDTATRHCCGYFDGTTCKNSCCDDWGCEYCDYSNWFWGGSGCYTCLRKASDYEELMDCSKVVPDPDYTPSPNGCGSAGGPPVPDNPAGCSDTSFLDACNTHDECYGECGSDRDSCDTVFLNAMLAVCMESSSCAYACSEAAYDYYGVVHNHGQSAYESAQVEACACCDC